MGYTHYWYRPKNLKAEPFTKFAADCQKIFDYCESELGIKLADAHGGPGTKPTANTHGVFFNGSEEQPPGVWTTTESIIIPWPSPLASLVEENADPSADKTDGVWFAGNLVSQRVAPLDNNTGKGSGSYESVWIERIIKDEKPIGRVSYIDKDGKEVLNDPDIVGKYFTFCKTAYRPYDLAVTAVLIAFKHYFPEIKISSDGEEKDWLDGKFLCSNLLGYGMDFYLPE